MKTYEQLLDEVVTSEYHRINPVAVNIHKNVAKRYAKQWIDAAAKISEMLYDHNFEILELKKEIDEQ